MNKKLIALFLFLANLYPIIGFYYYGWDILEVFKLYWLENFIFGFFNILMMITSVAEKLSYYHKLFVIIFFTLHYGLFTLAQGSFVLTILGHSSYKELFYEDSRVFLALFFIFLAHLVSFIKNYIGNGEYLKTKIRDLLFRPYKRIVVVHITILFTNFAFVIAIMLLNENFDFKNHINLLKTAAPILLVFIKSLMDLKNHLSEHKTKIFSAL